MSINEMSSDELTVRLADALFKPEQDLTPEDRQLRQRFVNTFRAPTQTEIQDFLKSCKEQGIEVIHI